VKIFTEDSEFYTSVFREF